MLESFKARTRSVYIMRVRQFLVVDLRTETGDWHPRSGQKPLSAAQARNLVFLRTRRPPSPTMSLSRGTMKPARVFVGVSWEIPEDKQRVGDPHALLLITRRRPGGPRTGSLSALISRDLLGIMTYCDCGDAVASTHETDPNVLAYVKNGRLVFSARGADAVRRIFRIVLDSVTFSRAHHDDPDSEEVFRFELSIGILICSDRRKGTSWRMRLSRKYRPPQARIPTTNGIAARAVSAIRK